MTVQCLNNVVFGGSLVTTVCHRLPLTVDTTPPFFSGIDKIYFDEHFDILGVYYRAGDNESHLTSVDFGLGKTKYDVLVRPYSHHKPMNGDHGLFIALEDLDLQEGVPAWPRIRVDNQGLVYSLCYLCCFFLDCIQLFNMNPTMSMLNVT